MDNSDSKLRNFYATFINPDAIKTFARELGCNCEDSVFNQIVVGTPSIFSGEYPGWDMQIMIGFRLLIAFVAVKRVKSTNEDIVKLLQAGKEIRDKNGLNRFRLVLLGEVEKELYEMSQKKAQELYDRIHVHFLEI
jgi:hypothetical protein